MTKVYPHKTPNRAARHVFSIEKNKNGWQITHGKQINKPRVGEWDFSLLVLECQR